MGLMDLFRSKAITSPVGRDPSAWSMLTGSWPTRWKNADSLFQVPRIQDMEAAYVHPIIRACVQEIATSIQEPRIEVGKYNGQGEWVPRNWHPILDVLKYPNDEYSSTDFISYIVTRWELTGWGFAAKLRARNGRFGGSSKGAIRELWPVPSSWVEPIKAKGGAKIFDGFKVRGMGLLPPEDVLRIRHIDPSTMGEVCSPYLSAYRDHALDIERETYLAEMMINLKIPGMVITKKDGWGGSRRKEDAKKDLRNAIGRGHRGEPLMLEGEVEVHMENPLGDMDWPGFSGSLETRMCMAFGVPPILIGSRFGLERSTYANYEQARESFYKETLRPKWNSLGEALTLGLLRAEGDSENHIRFVYEELPEFQENETDRSARTIAEFQATLITREEARAEIGRDPAYPGDELIEPSVIYIDDEDEDDENEEEDAA